MKTILTTLNAKYIHTSLALRWLYVANKDRFDISFREYVIKEDVGRIADELLASEPNVIGISVYIWNVEKSERLISILKERRASLIIVLGGPEVTYEPGHFLKHWNVDYVISGEGEFILGDLLAAIEDNQPIEIEGVSSIQNISRAVVKADMNKLASLSSPYTLDEDKADIKNRLV